MINDNAVLEKHLIGEPNIECVSKINEWMNFACKMDKHFWINRYSKNKMIIIVHSYQLVDFFRQHTDVTFSLLKRWLFRTYTKTFIKLIKTKNHFSFSATIHSKEFKRETRLTCLCVNNCKCSKCETEMKICSNNVFPLKN